MFLGSLAPPDQASAGWNCYRKEKACPKEWLFRIAAMARDLQHRPSERMATRINMLKLLQEVRSLTQFGTRQGETRPAGPLLLQFRGARLRKTTARRRRVIRIDMQEPPDIPKPVQITYLGQNR
jgi:hypothetical protein